MRREEVLRRLTDLRPWLTSQGIGRLRLFGSHARDEARDDSDVDLLVDLERPMGLRFFALQAEIAERLGAQVELVTEASLASDIRHRALRDAVDA